MKDLRFAHTLPEPLSMPDVKNEQKMSAVRQNIRIGDLHQVWRYGGTLTDPPADDKTIEASLEMIQNWIEKELQQ